MECYALIKLSLWWQVWHKLVSAAPGNNYLTITWYSGTEKEPKPKLFGPDIFQWGRGLPRERVGAKKFDTSLETREIKLFGRDIPGFCRDIPGAPEKFEKKKVWVQFSFPRYDSERIS